MIQPIPQMLRIKRKRTEDPIDIFILSKDSSKKKQKTSKSTILLYKLADSNIPANDTIDANAFKHIERVKVSVSIYLKHIKNVYNRISKSLNQQKVKMPEEKSLQERKDNTVIENLKRSSDSRYKVLAKRRHIRTSPEDEFELFDVVKDDEMKDAVDSKFDEFGIPKVRPHTREDILCNYEPMLREFLNVSITNDKEKDEEAEKMVQDDFVYDIYYADNDDENVYSSNINVAGLIWEDSGEFLEDGSEEDFDDDDEDSNCEEYWKNDYPEEEEYAEEIQDLSDDGDEESRQNNTSDYQSFI